MKRYSRAEKTDALEILPVFKGLNRQELELIAGICQEGVLETGEIVFKDCSPGSEMYVVLKGKVSIRVETITPHYKVGLTTVYPGEVFGEFSLLDSEPRSATATAVESTEVLIVDGTKMLELFEQNSRIGYVVMTNLTKTLCAKIRKTNKRLLNLIRVKLYD